jgi:hypothetical protein
MKKLIAFIASGVIPTFIPICALLTLPLCVAEKYIPQDLRSSFAYGISFFKLVINPHVNASSPPTTTRQVESIPVVESYVTSMEVAAPEVECDEMLQQAELVEVPDVDVEVETDHFAYAYAFPKREEFHKSQSEMRHLQYIRNMKLVVPIEKFEVAFEQAIKNVETRIEQRAQVKKNLQRPMRVVARKRPQLPA